MNNRRRLLAFNSSVKYIYKQGWSVIRNGNVEVSTGASIRPANILISATGHFSVSTDFTGYKRLKIEMSLMENSNYGIKYGFGVSNSTFTANDIKSTAERTVKEFNISSAQGEQFINVISSSNVGEKTAYVHNIWMEK